MESLGVLEINGIKMTPVMKAEIADVFINAIQSEKLLQKDIANNLNISPPELSFMKSSATWRYVKDSTWFKFIDWRKSGEKLADYINTHKGIVVTEVTADQIPAAVKQGLEANVKNVILDNKASDHILNNLLEHGELELQDDENIKEIQFRHKMKECWDELEKRGTVGKFLRSRGYSGKLTKIITQTIEVIV